MSGVPIVLLPDPPTVPVGLPGVPSIPGAVSPALPALVLADAAGLILNGPQLWGIFDLTGLPVLQADSVLAFEYARDYDISDYPQQAGSFQSYNKVQLPFHAKVTFLVGGPDANRTAFLAAAEAACASLNFVSVVMPEFSYAVANLTHNSFRREASRGAKLLTVEVWCEEVRVPASAQLTNSQSINASPTSQSGTVQPQATSPSPSGGYIVPSSAVSSNQDFSGGVNAAGNQNFSSTIPQSVPTTSAQAAQANQDFSGGTSGTAAVGAQPPLSFSAPGVPAGPPQ